MLMGSSVELEACENYVKQTYRNRCYILAGDGVQMLQVPVVHGPSQQIRDIKIDYSTPWVLKTKRALDTAYESSAFFEYYRDELFDILDSGEERLWDLNTQLTLWCVRKCHMSTAITSTATFAVPGTAGADDYRYCLAPKLPPILPQKPYYQVFADRMGGFTPRLSIIDLLFNEGPDALTYLK